MAQVLLSFFGVAALIMLAADPTQHLESALLLMRLAGLGAAAPIYVPGFIYAASAPAEERGFRLGWLSGSSQLGCIVFTYIFGTMRTTNEDAVYNASRLYAVTGASLAAASPRRINPYWWPPPSQGWIDQY